MSNGQTPGGAKPKPAPEVKEVIQPFKGNATGVTKAGTTAPPTSTNDTSN